ncbi:hypothetical protein ARMGADRAFT_1087085 [Armillaria gallica]|uniref:Uncharacterized protein n=1 Tax=Armillaria gallica TaxID=47427 RepID=A0A2H3D331_ARMGA|nr:hypothetical protein ARMGADRAFT_1087085 [Armillaria gallica]
MTIGGDTGDDRFIEKEMRTRVENQLSLLEKGVGGVGKPVFMALSEMQKRVATNYVDRVAGLSYLLLSEEIPAYYATQSEEDAWNALVDEVNMTHRGQMFFLYPQPGSGNKFWMTEVLPPPHVSNLGDGWEGFVGYSKERGVDYCHALCIESGYVRGLSQGSPEGSYRQGELIVEDITGAKHTFKIVTYYQCPIPEDSYTLVGSEPFDHYIYQVILKQGWVIGKRLPGQLFKKFSVFQISDKDEVKRLHDLAIATNAETDLA